MMMIEQGAAMVVSRRRYTVGSRYNICCTVRSVRLSEVRAIYALTLELATGHMSHVIPFPGRASTVTG